MSYNTAISVSILLLSGKPLDEVVKQTGQSKVIVNDTAWSLGWKPSWLITDHCSIVESIKRLAIEGELNLREIGEIHNLSRERIRQILSNNNINIKELRKIRLNELSIKVAEVLKSGVHTAESCSAQLGISTPTFHRAKSLISKSIIGQVNKLKSDKKKEKHLKYMEIAITMWPDHTAVEIAKTYNITAAYMNQLIIKYRKIYGWFPHKKKTLKKMEL